MECLMGFKEPGNYYLSYVYSIKPCLVNHQDIFPVPICSYFEGKSQYLGQLCDNHSCITSHTFNFHPHQGQYFTAILKKLSICPVLNANLILHSSPCSRRKRFASSQQSALHVLKLCFTLLSVISTALRMPHTRRARPPAAVGHSICTLLVPCLSSPVAHLSRKRPAAPDASWGSMCRSLPATCPSLGLKGCKANSS